MLCGLYSQPVAEVGPRLARRFGDVDAYTITVIMLLIHFTLRARLEAEHRD
jgi:hypothetical protein